MGGEGQRRGRKERRRKRERKGRRKKGKKKRKGKKRRKGGRGKKKEERIIGPGGAPSGKTRRQCIAAPALKHAGNKSRGLQAVGP
jgi:hypothetical protein